jgi:two-component system, cell cycle response regulator
MRMLIAEDDLTSRTILAGILRKWGYDPIAVTDGVMAWETLCRDDAPKLVLLDRNMPGMDGLEVCRRIRQTNSSDPPYIIILTSWAEKGNIVEGLDAGANDYVTKPWDNDELRARIRVGRRMVELQSELHLAKNALAREAMHDPLTGILNRRAILEALERELARSRRTGELFSIGMCDIDHFKRVNDTYGHQVGDEVLQGFVSIIRSALRKYDVMGRYGGEEFLVLVSGINAVKEAGVFERLCERVAGTSLVTRAGPIALSVSIGVAGSAGVGTLDEVVGAADRALFQAKKDGRWGC